MNTELKDLFDDFLQKNAYSLEPKGLFEPINYALGQGGKRFRPMLLLASYGAYRSDVEKALPAAMAIEVFHNFTLLHDDIMDEAPVRRGQPTVHIKYNTDTAILAGDAMMISAYQWLEPLAGHPNYATILSTFSATAMDVCRGQQLDMDYETLEVVSVENYVEMIRLKTAVLLGASLKIGALIGEASLSEADAFFDFGVNAGLAFQIQDDILDSFGDGHLVGKQIGGDILRDKKTFLWLKTLELSDDSNALTTNINQIQNPKEKIDFVKANMQNSGALDEAKRRRDHYYRQSINQINKLNLPEKTRKEFHALADQMRQRKF